MNFPFICSNISSAPAYGVYIYIYIYISDDTIWACGSYQDFIDRVLMLTRKLLNQGFFLVKLKSSLRKILRSPPWLGWPLWTICVPKDHGYVPLLRTSRSFPHSRLITGFVKRITQRVPLVEQELLPFRCTWVHLLFLAGFVLLDL